MFPLVSCTIAYMAEDGWKRLGTRIVQRRTELGMRTTKALAEKSRLTSRTLGDMENGRRTNYGPATKAAVEIALQWGADSINQIVAGGEPTPAVYPRVESIEQLRARVAYQEKVGLDSQRTERELAKRTSEERRRAATAVLSEPEELLLALDQSRVERLAALVDDGWTITDFDRTELHEYASRVEAAVIDLIGVERLTNEISKLRMGGLARAASEIGVSQELSRYIQHLSEQGVTGKEFFDRIEAALDDLFEKVRHRLNHPLGRLDPESQAKQPPLTGLPTQLTPAAERLLSPGKQEAQPDQGDFTSNEPPSAWDDFDAAARTAPPGYRSPGQAARGAQDRVGEESQDPA